MTLLMYSTFDSFLFSKLWNPEKHDKSDEIFFDKERFLSTHCQLGYWLTSSFGASGAQAEQ